MILFLLASAEELKHAASRIRQIIEDFKSNHKGADQAISDVIDELPFPFRIFAKIVWNGLEKEDNGSEQLAKMLERIGSSTDTEFKIVNSKLDELIHSQASNNYELSQVGKDMLRLDKNLSDIVTNKIDELSKKTDSIYRNTQTILQLLSKKDANVAYTDYDIFLGYRVVFDRPAFKRAYTFHSSRVYFLNAINDTIRAINTGRHLTRHGEELTEVKPKTFIRNKIWRDEMEQIEIDLSKIKQLEFELGPEEKTSQEQRDAFAQSMDKIRDGIVVVLNEIWTELGIPTLQIPSLYQGMEDTQRPLWDSPMFD